MPSLSSLKHAAVLALAGLAAGCAGPPWTIAQSPSAISLRWWSGDGSIARVDQVADAHCALYGRQAQLAQDQKSGSAEITTYRCD